MKKIIVSFFLGISLCSACYYDNSEELYGTTHCDASQVRWSTDIQPLIQGQCVSCHLGTSAAGGKDLSTYTSVKAALGGMVSIINKPVGDPLLMPPNTKLSTCSLTKMDAWVAAGAPQN